MPVSRPLVVVLAVAILALVGFYATSGSRQSSDQGASSQQQSAAAPEEVVTATTPAADAADNAPARKAPRRQSRDGVPAPVRRALASRKPVVLFFYKPGSADDRATARAVAGLRGRRGVAVFSAPIGRLASYRGVVEKVGISQAPAVVIVGRDRVAHLTEGFIDPATLAQDLADAR